MIIYQNIIPALALVIMSTGFLSSQSKGSSNSAEGRNYRIIFSLSSFHTAKPQDARAISQIFANHIKEAENRVEDLDIIVAEDIDEILLQAKLGFDLIIMTSKEYYVLNQLLPLEPVIINQTNGTVGFKYYLLVHKNEGITELNQLKGETINVLFRGGQNAPVLWLNKILKQKGFPVKEKFFKEIHYDFKVTNILLPVFFKKAKAALVTDHGFKLVGELNPQIEKELKIIAESNSIALGLGCFDAHGKEPERKKFLMNVLLNLHQTSYGKQILDFFATDQIVPFKTEYMVEFLKLMEN